MTAQRVNAERIVLLGWSRAILMQMAHPLIAAGVVEHSHFRAGARATAVRLHQTVRSMLSLTFGTSADHARTIATIQAIHRRVNGVLRHDVGPFAAGTRYSAEDPALLLWVHATLADSVLLAYDALVARLTAEMRDAYCREAAPVAVELGAREQDVPRTWAELQRFLADELASGRITVGEDARVVAGAVLHPPLSVVTGLPASLNRLLTVGWLPESLRAGYGFAWSAGRDRQAQRAARWFRNLRRVCPWFLARWPAARRGWRG